MVTIPLSALADALLYGDGFTWGMGGGSILVIGGFGLLSYAERKEEEDEKKETPTQARRRRRAEEAYQRWLSTKEPAARVMPKHSVGTLVAAEGQKGKFCMAWNWRPAGCHAGGKCDRRHACNVMVHKRFCCGSIDHRGRDHEGPRAA